MQDKHGLALNLLRWALFAKVLQVLTGEGTQCNILDVFICKLPPSARMLYQVTARLGRGSTGVWD